jgi:3-oxoadipate enol-lactonase
VGRRTALTSAYARGVITPPEAELVRSLDGTYVATRVVAEGDGLPVLLCNAIGADLSVWDGALEDVSADHPVVTWDHRGMHESGAPARGRLEPGAHVEDAVAVLDHHDLDTCCAVAWSNGARIALELAADHPHRVAGIVLVSGAYGQPLERFLRNLEPGALLPALAGVARWAAPLLEPAYRAVVERPELPGLVRQSGLLAPTADVDAVVGLLRAIARCDLGRLLRAYEQLASRGDDGLLGRAREPALLVAGARDLVVPPALMREVADSLADARLAVYEGATHLLPLEYPARLSEDIHKFVAELE